MGGKDVVYLKQPLSLSLQPAEVKKRLTEVADKRFTDVGVRNGADLEESHARDKVSLLSYSLSLTTLSPSPVSKNCKNSLPSTIYRSINHFWFFLFLVTSQRAEIEICGAQFIKLFPDQRG